MFCAKFNDTIFNFDKGSVYCKFCGGKACISHLFEARPEKYSGATVDKLSDTARLNEWGCPGCRSDKKKAKTINYNPNTGFPHKSHTHYNKHNPKNIWEIRASSQREIRAKAMACKYPKQYSYLKQNGGHPCDWPTQIKINNGELNVGNNNSRAMMIGNDLYFDCI